MWFAEFFLPLNTQIKLYKSKSDEQLLFEMWTFLQTSPDGEASEFSPVPEFSGRRQGECIPASQRCRKVRTPLWTRWSHCWSPRDTQSTGTGTAGKLAEGAAAQETEKSSDGFGLSQLWKCTLVTTGDATQWCRAQIRWSDAVVHI